MALTRRALLITGAGAGAGLLVGCGTDPGEGQTAGDRPGGTTTQSVAPTGNSQSSNGPTRPPRNPNIPGGLDFDPYSYHDNVPGTDGGSFLDELVYATRRKWIRVDAIYDPNRSPEIETPKGFRHNFMGVLSTQDFEPGVRITMKVRFPFIGLGQTQIAKPVLMLWPKSTNPNDAELDFAELFPGAVRNGVMEQNLNVGKDWGNLDRKLTKKDIPITSRVMSFCVDFREESLFSWYDIGRGWQELLGTEDPGRVPKGEHSLKWQLDCHGVKELSDGRPRRMNGIEIQGYSIDPIGREVMPPPPAQSIGW